MQIQFQYGDELLTLEVQPEGEGWRVRLPDGREHAFSARRLEGDVLEITEGERTFRVPFARVEGGVELSWAGQRFALAPAEARGGPSRSAGKSSGALTAPMVGVVAEVVVDDGQAVEAYQPVLVVEAMKVLATLEAPFAGTVRLHVARGDRVQHGALLAEVVPDPPAEPGDAAPR